MRYTREAKQQYIVALHAYRAALESGADTGEVERQLQTLASSVPVAMRGLVDRIRRAVQAERVKQMRGDSRQ